MYIYIKYKVFNDIIVFTIYVILLRIILSTINDELLREIKLITYAYMIDVYESGRAFRNYFYRRV